jgi:hypothetical protein
MISECYAPFVRTLYNLNKVFKFIRTNLAILLGLYWSYPLGFRLLILEITISAMRIELTCLWLEPSGGILC